jgi:hypothetical protein
VAGAATKQERPCESDWRWACWTGPVRRIGLPQLARAGRFTPTFPTGGRVSVGRVDSNGSGTDRSLP